MDLWTYIERCSDFLSICGYINIQILHDRFDYGCDILAEFQGVKYCISCLFQDGIIDEVVVIQQLIAEKVYHGCDRAMVITNSIFHENVEHYARQCKVVMWEEIDEVVFQDAFQEAEDREFQPEVDVNQRKEQLIKEWKSWKDYCIDAWIKTKKLQFNATQGQIRIDKEKLSFQGDNDNFKIRNLDIICVFEVEDLKFQGETFGRTKKNCIQIAYFEGDEIKKVNIKVHNVPIVAREIERRVQLVKIMDKNGIK